jgi:menaquinone-dependent protoporphyrinogen oxidase
MNVLIAVASKHGSTREIAEVIGRVLAEEGLTVVVRKPTEVSDLNRYDAVIVGSALYFGQWQSEAMMFVRTHAHRLDRVPVWTFSSGEIVLPDIDQSARNSHLVALSNPLEHRHFGGRLDRSRLNTVERMLIERVQAEDSDQRDWNEIRAWAKAIALTLQEMPHLDEVESTTTCVAGERQPGVGPSPGSSGGKGDAHAW